MLGFNGGTPYWDWMGYPPWDLMEATIQLELHEGTPVGTGWGYPHLGLGSGQVPPLTIRT